MEIEDRPIFSPAHLLAWGFPSRKKRFPVENNHRNRGMLYRLAPEEYRKYARYSKNGVPTW